MNPIDRECDGCTAEPGESCRPWCLSNAPGVDDEPRTIDLVRVVALLREAGWASANLEMTGGNVATIFAGQTRVDAYGDHRYAAIAGPGDFHAGTAYASDFYIGADDDGESEPLHFPAWGDELLAARIIASQARLSDPSRCLVTYLDDVDDALRAYHEQSRNGVL